MPRMTRPIAVLALLVASAACDEPVVPDVNNPPELSIVGLDPSQEIAEDFVVVEGVVEDPEGIARLTYQLDGGEVIELQVEVGAKYHAFEIMLENLELGDHELVVTVEDLAGSVESVRRAFTIVEPAPPFETGDFVFRELGGGLERPLEITAPPADDRVFVVEQGGLISIYEDGVLLTDRFLDIRGQITYEGEQGLLGLAFHPDYATNGYLYILYIDTDRHTRVVRYTLSADPNRVDMSTAKLILKAEQAPDSPIHKAGSIMFGPDGMLYIPLGDGSGPEGHDTHGNSQDTGTLLGALLRIDVDGGDPYAIPADNPFFGSTTHRPEIIAYGLRNPWQIWIDADGTLYVPDVGDRTWEEINIFSDFSDAPNFGWPIMEGMVCLDDPDCDPSAFRMPDVVLPQPGWCSVIGGLVYRGQAFPELVGHYVYGDLCGGFIHSFRYSNGRVTEHVQWDVDPIPFVSAIGAGADGEIYAVSVREGTLYALERPN